MTNAAYQERIEIELSKLGTCHSDLNRSADLTMYLSPALHQPEARSIQIFTAAEPLVASLEIFPNLHICRELPSSTTYGLPGNIFVCNTTILSKLGVEKNS